MKMIPKAPEDINESGLSCILSSKFPGVSVSDCEITHLSGGTNHHVHIGALFLSVPRCATSAIF